MRFYDSTAHSSDPSHPSSAALALPSSALARVAELGRFGGVLIPVLAMTLALLAPAPSAAGGRADTQKIRVVRDVDVRVWTNKGEGSRYCVGEEIEISFRTNRDAWVAIVDFDTRGRAHRIFPNRFDREHFVRGGKTYRLPIDGYSLEVEGPPGHEVVTAIASTDRYELRRAVDHLIESSRYLPTYGHRGKGYSGKVYTDRGSYGDYDRGDYDRYGDDRYGDDGYYEHRDYEKIVVTAEDAVAFDSVSHRVRDGRRCHRYDSPRHRPWWYR